MKKTITKRMLINDFRKGITYKKFRGKYKNYEDEIFKIADGIFGEKFSDYEIIDIRFCYKNEIWEIYGVSNIDEDTFEEIITIEYNESNIFDDCQVVARLLSED